MKQTQASPPVRLRAGRQGQIWLASLGASPLVSLAVVALIFWGTGQAFMQTANVRQIYTSLPRNDLHLAPSINLVVMTLGSTTGQAFASLAVEKGRAATDTGAGLVAYLSDAMLVIALFFGVGMIVTQLLPRIFLKSRMESAGQPVVTEVAAPTSDPEGSKT